MKKLVIVQPYIPSYRAQFFQTLDGRLREAGVDLSVLSGRPSSAQGKRGDAVNLSFQIETRTREVRFRNRSFNLGGTASDWKDADGVILGLEGTSIDLYRAVLHGRSSKLAVGAWGHVKSYVNAGNALDIALERWQMNHVDHVFAYTKGGATHAEMAGVERSKVTAVMNSVDTASLERAKSSLQSSPNATQETRSLYGVGDNPVLAYVGGLDKPKRIEFLAAALNRLWELAPHVKVLVAGKGEDSKLLDSAVSRGQVRMLGYADDPVKARLGLISEAFLMPGRVGLVAVESMLLKRPLLTTNWAFHSAEFEYLSEGSTKHTSEDDPHAYAQLMSWAIESQKDTDFTDAPEWKYPTLDEMVNRYTDGVKTMMGIH